MKHPLIVALFASLLFACAKSTPHASPTTAPSIQGEGWESSGGSGVACYESEEAARSGDRAKIKSLVTLEAWECEDTFDGMKGKSRAEIFALLDARFEKYAPIFYTRYKMARARIGFGDWKPNAQIPRVDDAHPKKDVEKKDPRCRVVQLAVRYSKSRPGYLPEAYVEVDRALFDKHLDPLNQAILILHEEMYLLQKELRVRTSDELRQHVSYLFTDDMTKVLYARELREKEAKRQHVRLTDTLSPANTLQAPIAVMLGDYYLYFTSDPLDRPAVVPTKPGQYSRYVAFGNMLKIFRDRKDKCLDEGDYDRATKEKQQELQQHCSFFAVRPDLTKELLSDEESFLFISRWVLDRVRAMENSENLVVWDRANPETMTELQASELGLACKAVQEINLPVFKDHLQKAARYCIEITK